MSAPADQRLVLGPQLAQIAPRRVALVHDWLVTMRGGERVLDALCELFPEATLHTLVRQPGIATPRIEAMRHVTSRAGRIPGASRRHRWLLPLYPSAIEHLDLSGFDLVVSSSHCVAKGVIAAPDALHVCYCHTPVRYAWDRTEDYVQGSSPLLRFARPAIDAAAAWLRRWDLRTAGRVDVFVANSQNTANKINQFYHRQAIVVAPPVECGQFEALPRQQPGSYDLVLGGLVPYKRVDLAIAAWSLMPDRQLVIVGDGPERQRLQRLAPPNVRFEGRVAESELAGWYAGARMLVFPGEEDAGIVPVEAQAAGVPVLALGRGGALETVVDGQTGLFFDNEEPAAIARRARELDALQLPAGQCRRHARRFDRGVFLTQMRDVIETALTERARRTAV